MVAYGSIFASSFAANIPLGNLATCDIYSEGFYSACMGHYWVYILIYSFLVTILTVKGLKEQKNFQILMCSMRFVIMSLVIFSSLHLILSKLPIAPGESPPNSNPPLFNYDKTDIALPIILFALGYQLQLPSIADLIANKQRNLWRIITLVTIVSLVWYAALGVIVPYAINNIEEQCTLNFRNYSAGYNYRPWWAIFISYVIVLFPAFDVMSSFPLMSVALADNWVTMLYGDSEVPIKKIRIIRIGVCVIPLVISFFFYNIVRDM
jgi:hypothetical protein